jgi:hypothetical protein
MIMEKGERWGTCCFGLAPAVFVRLKDKDYNHLYMLSDEVGVDLKTTP